MPVLQGSIVMFVLTDVDIDFYLQEKDPAKNLQADKPVAPDATATPAAAAAPAAALEQPASASLAPADPTATTPAALPAAATSATAPATTPAVAPAAPPTATPAALPNGPAPMVDTPAAPVAAQAAAPAGDAALAIVVATPAAPAAGVQAPGGAVSAAVGAQPEVTDLTDRQVTDLLVANGFPAATAQAAAEEPETVDADAAVRGAASAAAEPDQAPGVAGSAGAPGVASGAGAPDQAVQKEENWAALASMVVAVAQLASQPRPPQHLRESLPTVAPKGACWDPRARRRHLARRWLQHGSCR